MAPKKVAPPAVAVVEEEDQPSVADDSKEAKPKKLVKSLGHPPTLSMVIEVLKKNTEKKGTSVQAIRNQILAAHPTVDPVRLKFLLKSALNRGIEKGIIIRPANSHATGATGRFKLAKPVSKPKEPSNGKMSENDDPNAEPKEKTKKPPKKAKAAKQEASKGEKAEKKVKATGKTEKSEEKPKAAANKPKKDPEVKTDKAPAAAKKPKAKAEGDDKAKKEPVTKEEKTKPPKAKKDPEEASEAKSNKKAKK